MKSFAATRFRSVLVFNMALVEDLQYHQEVLCWYCSVGRHLCRKREGLERMKMVKLSARIFDTWIWRSVMTSIL